jgi:small neutral amino acid transporter SnatA (MarC family)
MDEDHVLIIAMDPVTALALYRKLMEGVELESQDDEVLLDNVAASLAEMLGL